jgi:hypothetical protein
VGAALSGIAHPVLHPRAWRRRLLGEAEHAQLAVQGSLQALPAGAALRAAHFATPSALLTSKCAGPDPTGDDRTRRLVGWVRLFACAGRARPRMRARRNVAPGLPGRDDAQPGILGFRNARPPLVCLFVRLALARGSPHTHSPFRTGGIGPAPCGTHADAQTVGGVLAGTRDPPRVARHARRPAYAAPERMQRLPGCARARARVGARLAPLRFGADWAAPKEREPKRSKKKRPSERSPAANALGGTRSHSASLLRAISPSMCRSTPSVWSIVLPTFALAMHAALGVFR